MANETSALAGFMDIRKYGYFRVAAITPPVVLANPYANAQNHIEFLRMALMEGVAYAAGPELGLTGYSCGDLFHSERLQEDALSALEYVLVKTVELPMMFTVGMPLVVEDKLFNVAVTCVDGKILAVTPKAYPPEYREFYETRHFALASETKAKSCKILGQTVPFGTDILITWPAHNNHFVLHTSICEDLWVSIPPSTIAALHGATVLANLSASNITIGKSEYREHLVLDSSARNIAVQIYSAAGTGESTNDLAWDGDAFIAERGQLLTRSKRFAQDGGFIIADVDLSILVQERIKQNSFRANRADYPMEFRHMECSLDYLPLSSKFFKDLAKVFEKLYRKIDSHPFVPDDPTKRDERCHETFMIQATALAGKLRSLPERMRKVFIGVSGGLDSTWTLLVAAYTMDLLKLSRTNIFATTMPGFGTTKRTKGNADKLIEAVGATYLEIPIGKMAKGRFVQIGYDPEADGHGVTFENVQAWERFQVLLAESSMRGGIVLGTGDLSELCLGWCTMYGDHSSHYGVNTGVPKTLIKYLIDWAKDHVFQDEEMRKVISDILSTPISPELLPADKKGQIVQKTEEKVGPYELHDFFIYWTIRHGATPDKIARLALEAFDGKYSLVEIKKWLKVFVSRFFANQFKRNVMPEGPKVGLVTVNPRGDWRMPSDAKPDIWLAAVEAIPDSQEE